MLHGYHILDLYFNPLSCKIKLNWWNHFNLICIRNGKLFSSKVWNLKIRNTVMNCILNLRQTFNIIWLLGCYVERAIYFFQNLTSYPKHQIPLALTIELFPFLSYRTTPCIWHIESSNNIVKKCESENLYPTITKEI